MIVDTYFDEAPDLATWVGAALGSGANDLKVSIYILNPQLPFGGQRLLEQEQDRRKRDVSPFRRIYEEEFVTYCREIDRNLRTLRGKSNFEFEIHTYDTMPSIRLFIVDDSEFIFGWFPLKDRNPGHVCFHITARSFAEADSQAVSSLRNHINEIMKESELVRGATYDTSRIEYSEPASVPSAKVGPDQLE